MKRDCVKVAPQTLTLFVRVRILLPLPRRKPCDFIDHRVVLCPLKRLITTVFTTITIILPLIWPFTGQCEGFYLLCFFDLLNIVLHTGGAVFFHFLAHLAVSVKRKCRCSMSEVANSFVRTTPTSIVFRYRRQYFLFRYSTLLHPKAM